MKWEYKTLSIKSLPDEDEWLSGEKLTELGQEGWELVAIADTLMRDFRGSSIYIGIAYFKRLIQEEMTLTLPHPIQERARVGETIQMEVDTEDYK